MHITFRTYGIVQGPQINHNRHCNFSMMSSASYRVAGLGGTFDHFHKGHERFILFAARISERVQIGVTQQDLVLRKPLASLCQTYEVRVQAVAEFCEKHDILYEIVPLHDVYGPTLEGSRIDVLCVTEETAPGGELINKARKERGLSELPIRICDYYLDELGRPLHSLGIRAGIVNKEGIVYKRILQNTVILNPYQREFFSKPQGIAKHEVVESSKEGVFVVGDATLEYFIRQNLPYQLGVYDKKRDRTAVSSAVINALRPDVVVENASGLISVELVEALQRTLQTKSKHVLVRGEEDLAAVALVLLLPLHSLIYYGQPNRGMVEIRVTEEVKDKFYKVLSAR